MASRSQPSPLLQHFPDRGRFALESEGFLMLLDWRPSGLKASSDLRVAAISAKLRVLRVLIA